MTIAMDPPRKWWQAGPGEVCIGFTESKIVKVLARGNRQVPELALAVCDRIGLPAKDIDLLVTNQPNRVFLHNWREALELPKERHVDTFDECGNLFAAGIPVNLDRAIADGQLKKGDVVMMASFAHAGDFAGAAAFQWAGTDKYPVLAHAQWIHAPLARGPLRPPPNTRDVDVPFREPARGEERTLGSRSYGRKDAGMPLGPACTGRAIRVPRMDRRQSSAAFALRCTPRGQEATRCHPGEMTGSRPRVQSCQPLSLRQGGS